MSEPSNSTIETDFAKTSDPHSELQTSLPPEATSSASEDSEPLHSPADSSSGSTADAASLAAPPANFALVSTPDAPSVAGTTAAAPGPTAPVASGRSSEGVAAGPGPTTPDAVGAPSVGTAGQRSEASAADAEPPVPDSAEPPSEGTGPPRSEVPAVESAPADPDAVEPPFGGTAVESAPAARDAAEPPFGGAAVESAPSARNAAEPHSGGTAVEPAPAAPDVAEPSSGDSAVEPAPEPTASVIAGAASGDVAPIELSPEGADRSVGEAVQEELDELADPERLRCALEAVLLVVDTPTSSLLLAQVLGRSVPEVESALRALRDEFDAGGRGMDLREVADGWRLYSRDEFATYVERFILDGQQARLTQASLETLAVIAYRQPVTRSRISGIRGVSVDAVMRTLLTRGLVEECGADPDTGGGLYRTTRLFLEKMGLRSLDELPSLAPLLPDTSQLDDVELST